MSIITPSTVRPTFTEPANVEQLRSQAKELESVFINTLMKQMFSGIKTDSQSMGGGFAEETWRGMQAEQLSAQIAESGGLGIADSILGDLIAMQEAAQNAQPAFTKGAYQ